MPLFWAPRTPVLITGAAGSGKTELWRQLTGGNAADAMSEDPEDSYFYPGSRAGSRPWRKRRITLTTIPGQPSRTRYKNMNWFFGPETEINGVIFVATFGFDQVWPKRADSVASRLDPFCIQALSAHNIKQELESFRLTCEKIQEKRVMSDVDLGPRWMLVLVNKIDLYWDGREQAEAYYGPTAATPFNDVATRCLPREDAFADFEYRVLPITRKAAD